ncbi:MAG TPA: phenylalanine--tRNA ligase subunit alpha [Thermohalobaculum sp.]|nr:phenylalanine--tRNA ligase subunit alpha [Thermohalobaculum sp.]
MQDLDALRARLLGDVAAAGDEAAIEAVRVRALGRKGEVTRMMRGLGAMAPEARREAGPKLNALKDEIDAAIAARKAALADAALAERLETEWLDVTLPARPQARGTLHPVSQVMEEVIAIWADLGFSVAEGPEIETGWYNFDALNIPPEHPARQEMDTFYLHRQGGEHSGGEHSGDNRPAAVLRTHTSPVQIRYMEAHGVPCRIIAPGRVYRSDYDQTHTPMFHQYEGLAIDHDISMAQLKWVLEEFCRAFFEVDGVELRFRASHFPFTEPSAEVDIRCSWKGGQLKIGEGDSWMEILGSGMVHPKVLAAAGVDPERWQGFAFGMGIDRIAMLKYGIPDLRAFFESDLRWLRHYGFAALDVPTVHGGLSA